MIKKILLCILIVAALTVSPMVGSDHTVQAGVSRIRIAMNSDTPTMDPHMHAEKMGVQIDNALHDPLFFIDANLKLIPALATDFKVINDTTVEVYLRKGVKFINGEDFNADTVKFNFERILNPENKVVIRGKAAWIESIDVIDDYTVRFFMKDPYPIWRYQLASIVMIPKKYFTEKGAEYYAEHPVGTGAYKLVSWNRGSEIKMIANENYYRGAAPIKEVIWKVIPDDAVCFASLMSGDVDLVNFVNPDNIPALKANPNIVYSQVDDLRFGWVCLSDALNPDSPLFDKRVRQALNYAVDWDTIIDKIIFGLGTKTTSLNTMMFGYDPSVKPYPYDPEKAKQLLAEAGYPNGFKTVYNMTTVNQVKGEEVHQAVQAYWKKIGVDAKIVKWSGAGYMKMVASGKSRPIYILNWGCYGIPDADVILYPFFHSKGTYGNFWNSPETDKLIMEQHTSLDPEVRKKAISKAMHIIREEAPWLFQYGFRRIDAWSKKIDFKPRKSGRIWAWEIGLK